MAGEEPPYLTVGTDVSAKYKGAFCEAKIKKVMRTVKCKVTFKNNAGTAVVTDDLVRGTLRVGAHVEAKHPEKIQYLEAIINKLHDYSQYTVVFDDGDETTLRRTSLCLKSGRHFAESETLDQLPLTHPEHFGTPVMGSKGRKRRSLHRSLIIGDVSSDEEPSVRKKDSKIKEADPDMGKVVCVDLGDKKKQKDNWVPGLIVSPSAQDAVKVRCKDEYMIRSFKDGKYHVVSKKDTREFNREVAAKVDSNTLKTAVEKALLYLEKDELPPHWDRDILFGVDNTSNDENSDQDTDSESSDDEQSEEKDRFVAQLYKFMDDRGTPINKAPTVSNRDLNLYRLFKVVQKLGGYNRATTHMQWKTVYTKMRLPAYNSSSSHQIKQAYKKYLHSFEDFYRKLGCTMGTSTRSGRVRHRSGRSLLLTRDRDREFKAAGRRVAKPEPKLLKKEKEDESEKSKDDKDSKDESDGDGNDGENQLIPEDAPVEGLKVVPTERVKSDEDSKEEKIASEKQSDRDDSDQEDEKAEKEGKLRSKTKSDTSKSEESPSPKRRGRKKIQKRGDMEDEEKSQASDDDTEEPICTVGINIGDRVKVKYGRGRQQKIYEAKVLKLDEEDGDNIFFVHYTGWNMRYDEWVKRHRIVENLTQRTIGKRTRLTSGSKHNTLKPTAKRGRPQGSTAIKSQLITTGRKSSSAKSRSTRSDRNSLVDSPFVNGLEPRKRVRKTSGQQETATGTDSDDSTSVESEELEQMDRRSKRLSCKKGTVTVDDLDTSIEEKEKDESLDDDEDDEGDVDLDKKVENKEDKESCDFSLLREGSWTRGETSSNETADDSQGDGNDEKGKKFKSPKKSTKEKVTFRDSDDEAEASESDIPSSRPVRRSRGRPAKQPSESPKRRIKERKAKIRSESDEDDDADDDADDAGRILPKISESLSGLKGTTRPSKEEDSLESKSPTVEPLREFKPSTSFVVTDHEYSDPLKDVVNMKPIFSSRLTSNEHDEIHVALRGDDSDDSMIEGMVAVISDESVNAAAIAIVSDFPAEMGVIISKGGDLDDDASLLEAPKLASAEDPDTPSSAAMPNLEKVTVPLSDFIDTIPTLEVQQSTVFEPTTDVISHFADSKLVDKTEKIYVVFNTDMSPSPAAVEGSSATSFCESSRPAEEKETEEVNIDDSATLTTATSNEEDTSVNVSSSDLQTNPNVEVSNVKELKDELQTHDDSESRGSVNSVANVNNSEVEQPLPEAKDDLAEESKINEPNLNDKEEPLSPAVDSSFGMLSVFEASPVKEEITESSKDADLTSANKQILDVPSEEQSHLNLSENVTGVVEALEVMLNASDENKQQVIEVSEADPSLVAEASVDTKEELSEQSRKSDIISAPASSDPIILEGAHIKVSKKDRRKQKNKKPEKRKINNAESSGDDGGSTEDEPKVKKKKSGSCRDEKAEGGKTKGESKARRSRDKKNKSKKSESDRDEGRSQRKKSGAWKSRRKECKKKKETLDKGRRDEERILIDSDDASSISSDGGVKKKAKKSRKHRGEKNRDGPESEKRKSKKQSKLSSDGCSPSEDHQSDDSNREIAKKVRKEEKSKKKKKERKKDPHSSDDSDCSKLSVGQNEIPKDKWSSSEKVDKGTSDIKLEPSEGSDWDMSNYLMCEEKVPASPVADEMIHHHQQPTSDRANMPKEATTSAFVPSSSGTTVDHRVTVPSFTPLTIRPKHESETSTVLDNTPPTTPESSGGTVASDSPQHEQGSLPASPSRDGDNTVVGCSSSKSSQSSSPNTYVGNFQSTSMLEKCKVEEPDDSSCGDQSPTSIGHNDKDKISSGRASAAVTVAATSKRLKPEFEESAPSRKKKKSHKRQLDAGKSSSSIVAATRHRHGSSRTTTKVGSDSDDHLHMLDASIVSAASAAASIRTSSDSLFNQVSASGILLDSQGAPRSPRPSRYNFFVELDDYSDGAERIAILQEKLTELRRTYMALKAEVACIDRRRKKLRRKEKEGTTNAPNSSTSTIVECS